jgi:hypothetical protein
MKVRSDISSRRASGASKLVWAGVCMAVGASVSILAMVRAVHGNDASMLWFGELSVTLIFGSSLCLFFALARLIQSRKRLPMATMSPVTVSLDEEYTAEYSWGDRIIALGLALFFGWLTAFFLLRSAKLRPTILSAIFFCWAAWYVVHTTGTRVGFSRQGIVARLSWFRELSEPWASVIRISSKPGTLKIEFTDGRSLKLRSGLGDANTVVAHLQARCPNSVHVA